MNLRKLMLNLLLILALLEVETVLVSAQMLVIDGQFDDWVGQPHVDDTVGDSKTPNTDVITFYWGTNPNDEHVYWMMERTPPQGGNAKVYYGVAIDTNGNGRYTDSADRLVVVMYDPQKDQGLVEVMVFSGSGTQINRYSGNWGESIGQGGRKAEWRVSFADLGIDAHQTIHMFAGAAQNTNLQGLDRVPDQGDITWAPIPVLGWPWLILAFVVIVGLVWWTRGRRRWTI